MRYLDPTHCAHCKQRAPRCECPTFVESFFDPIAIQSTGGPPSLVDGEVDAEAVAEQQAAWVLLVAIAIVVSLVVIATN